MPLNRQPCRTYKPIKTHIRPFVLETAHGCSAGQSVDPNVPTLNAAKSMKVWLQKLFIDNAVKLPDTLKRLQINLTVLSSCSSERSTVCNLVPRIPSQKRVLEEGRVGGNSWNEVALLI